MSSTTHTPGPWRVSQDRWIIQDECSGSDGLLASVLSKQWAQNGDSRVLQCTATKNARLIAAAPELLEALKACERIQHMHLEVIQAAIAKAEGRGEHDKGR